MVRHIKKVHGLLPAPLPVKRSRPRRTYGQKLEIVQEWHKVSCVVDQKTFCVSKMITPRMLRRFALQLNELTPLRKWNTLRALPGKVSPFQKENDRLYEAFLLRRKIEGLKVTDRWLRVQMRKIVEAAWVEIQHGSNVSISIELRYTQFKASNGWLMNWKTHYRVSHQRRTEKKPVNAEALELCLREFHRMMFALQATPSPNPVLWSAKFGRFSPKRFWNVDQIPLQYGCKSTTSLNMKGEPCWVAQLPGKKDEYRFATLILTLRGAGEQVVGPAVVFKGQGKLSNELIDELDACGVKYFFQPKAWADNSVCLKHFQHMLDKIKPIPEEENLLLLDNFSAQSTDEFALHAYAYNFLSVYLPPNTTHLLQPIDHHVGAFMKNSLKDGYLIENEEILNKARQGTVDDERDAQAMRCSMLKWVKIAWDRALAAQELIPRSFTSTGIIFHQDGSHLISIPTLPDYDPDFLCHRFPSDSEDVAQIVHTD